MRSGMSWPSMNPRVLDPCTSSNWRCSTRRPVACSKMFQSSRMSGCIRYTETNSSVSWKRASWCSCGEPMIPLKFSESPDGVLDVRTEDPGVVDVHRQPQRRGVDDARRPLDGVDLRHQRRVDEPGGVEQALVVPARVLLLEHVADRVVLLGEQRVEAREPEPPVLVEAGGVDAGLLGVGEQAAVVADLELAVLHRAQRSEEHTSELQSRQYLVCRLLLEKKKNND